MPRIASATFVSLAAAVALAAALPAAAQSDAAGSAASPGAGGDLVQQQLDAMRQELEKIRGENQSMKGEIDELRAATDESWLTEARADEIRGLVADTLADADTRSSLLQDGLPAGWSEHFFLSSLDGRFMLILEGEMQIRWIYNYHDEADRHRHGFENTRTRLTFRGHIFDEDIEYLVRGEFGRAGGTDTLLDAWVRHNFSDKWSLRFGQFKLPFNREELVSPFEQLAVERSLLNEFLNIGRSQGIELIYHDDVNRFAFAYSDGGSFSPLGNIGPPSPRTNTGALVEDTEYSVTARYERLVAGTWDQFNDFTSPRGDEFGLLLGGAMHAQEGEFTGIPAGGRNEIRVFGYTLDASAEFGGTNAFLSFTHLYVDNPAVIVDFYGIVAQGGVYVAPKWELFVRGEYGWVSVHNNAASDLGIVTAGANYYLDGHDLKWTTDIGFGLYQIEPFYTSDLAGWRGDSNGVYPQIVFRTQFQLLF